MNTTAEHDRSTEGCTGKPCPQCTQVLNQIDEKHKQVYHAIKQIHDGLSAGEEAETGVRIKMTLRAVWLDARDCLGMADKESDPEQGTGRQWEGDPDLYPHSDIEDPSYGENEDTDENTDEEDWSMEGKHQQGEFEYDAAGDEEVHEEVKKLGLEASAIDAGGLLARCWW